MNKKRGVAIELAVFAMVIATAFGGLIATNLLFGSSKTSRLLNEAKERAEIDSVADKYIEDGSSDIGEYTAEETDENGSFVVKKNGEVKLTITKNDEGEITEWKY